jgi:hypothetical protein
MNTLKKKHGQFSLLINGAVAIGIIAIVLGIVAQIEQSIQTQPGVTASVTNVAVVNESMNLQNNTYVAFANTPVISLTQIANTTHVLVITGNITSNSTHIALITFMTGLNESNYKTSYVYTVPYYGYAYNATQGGLNAIGTFSGFQTTVAIVVVGVAVLFLMMKGLGGLSQGNPTSTGGI